MVLGAKSIGANRFEHHLLARKLKSKSFKKVMVAALMLTAMVDMFSVLVIFLLQTFSASPEILVTKGVALPAARTGGEIKDAPVLSLTANEVFLDQKLVGRTEQILRNPEPLGRRLSELRTRWMETYPDREFSGEINLQADRDVPSTTVSQLMGVLPGQAYSTIQLAVVSGSVSLENVNNGSANAAK